MPAEAQSLRGRVVDESGAAIDQAIVVLLRDSATEISRTIAGSGEFLLRALDPGDYRVRVERIGYQTTTSERISLTANEERFVTVRLGREAIPLEPVTVEIQTAAEPPFLADVRRRMRLGFGQFLLRHDLDMRRDVALSAMLSGVPGVRVRSTSFGDPVIALSGATPALRGDGVIYRFPPQNAEEAYLCDASCPPALYMNGSPVFTPSAVDPERITADDARSLINLGTLRQFFNLRSADIEAVEIYRGASEIPDVYAGARAGCGVIAIWLRRDVR